MAGKPNAVKQRPGSVRVATLTRISTDETNQPYSLEAQALGLTSFVASQPGHTITHRFVDQASGATLERPGLQAALTSARAGEFDVLLVYRIDRLTRSIVGLMTLVEELGAAGVALRSATEPIDTQGPVGRMLLQLLGIFAEFERGLLIDRIAKGFERKAARGEWLSGPGPFGYRSDPVTKSLIPVSEEAAIVRAMFAAYADERLGATVLAKRLNDTGQRNRNGRLWSNQTVLRVLRNPVYLGKISHRGTVYEGKHDPVIDEDLFTRAQAILGQRTSHTTTVAPSTSAYLLTGLLRCQACHGAYVGVGAHGRSGFYRYYVCRTRQAKGTRACPGRRIRATDLESAVTTALLETYEDSDLFHQAAVTASRESADERPRIQAELASTEAQLRETTVGIERYLRAFEAGTMPEALCAPRVEELSARKDELSAHRTQLVGQLHSATPVLPTHEELRTLTATVRRAVEEGSPNVVKQVLCELIDRVEISPEREVQPYFWIPEGGVPGRKGTRVDPVRIGSREVEVLAEHSRKDRETKELQELLVMVPEGPPPRIRYQRQHRLSREQITEVVAAYQQGATLNELAQRHNTRRQSISRALERAGVPRRYRRIGPSELLQATEMYQAGKSLVVIATQLGVAPNTIRSSLSSAGVVMRDTHGRSRPEH